MELDLVKMLPVDDFMPYYIVKIIKSENSCCAAVISLI